jgi:gluconokinase
MGRRVVGHGPTLRRRSPAPRAGRRVLARVADMDASAAVPPQHPSDIVVVMGVAGSGKTTVAKGLAVSMHWLFAEGDAFHPEANVAKMHSGVPLTDEDRWPWLRLIGDWMSEQVAAGTSAVVTCSALRRVYRDVLREGRPAVRFLHVTLPEGAIADRLEHRKNHYMPPSLLPSQLATLEPLAADEPGVEVSGYGSETEVLARALDALGLTPRV